MQILFFFFALRKMWCIVSSAEEIKPIVKYLYQNQISEQGSVMANQTIFFRFHTHLAVY